MSRIDDAFKTFHRDNPHVYAMLVKLAREWKTAGHSHCGVKALWERMRWELGLHTTEEAPRLNNVYTSRYARLIEQNEPDLLGLFEMRALRS